MTVNLDEIAKALCHRLSTPTTQGTVFVISDEISRQILKAKSDALEEAVKIVETANEQAGGAFLHYCAPDIAQAIRNLKHEG